MVSLLQQKNTRHRNRLIGIMFLLFFAFKKLIGIIVIVLALKILDHASFMFNK